MNLTLSIEEQLIRRAREVAESMGTSVNQLVRDYLEHLTSQGDVERELAELERLSDAAKGDSRGWKFNREEIYELS